MNRRLGRQSHLTVRGWPIRVPTLRIPRVLGGALPCLARESAARDPGPAIGAGGLSGTGGQRACEPIASTRFPPASFPDCAAAPQLVMPSGSASDGGETERSGLGARAWFTSALLLPTAGLPVLVGPSRVGPRLPRRRHMIQA